LSDLPGYELVSRGLADLASGRESVEAALVSIGGTRLSRLGLRVPQSLDEPEERLYELLEAAYPSDAVHNRYNALVRRLVSFERTLAGIQSGRS
jgi:hypothetical protein